MLFKSWINFFRNFPDEIWTVSQYNYETYKANGIDKLHIIPHGYFEAPHGYFEADFETNLQTDLINKHLKTSKMFKFLTIGEFHPRNSN